MTEDSIQINTHLGEQGGGFHCPVFIIFKKMKTYKCPNCKQVYEKPDDTVLVQCGCGERCEHVDPKTHEVLEDYDYIDTRQKHHSIQREDVVCAVCGRTDWITKLNGFLICECGHEQEDN